MENEGGAMSDLDRIDGLYVGMLDEDELKLFERARKDGDAIRSYDHVAGAVLGLAKVKIIRPQP